MAYVQEPDDMQSDESLTKSSSNSKLSPQLVNVLSKSKSSGDLQSYASSPLLAGVPDKIVSLVDQIMRERVTPSTTARRVVVKERQSLSRKPLGSRDQNIILDIVDCEDITQCYMAQKVRIVISD